MYYRSDVGKIRAHNEDAAEIFRNEFATVLTVADGMGGHAYGDIASQLVIEKVRTRFEALTQFEDQEAARIWLKSILQEANDEIIAYIEKNNVEKGMGTTVIIAVLTRHFIALAHVGDSRAYLLANGKLRQVTKDHTFVRKLIEEGKLTEKKAKSHPHRNIIMNALGVGLDLKFDYLVVENYDLDAVLLCTDGLTSMAEDKDIQSVLEEPQSTVEKVEKLIKLANEMGGRDNVTAALYEFGEGRAQL